MRKVLITFATYMLFLLPMLTQATMIEVVSNGNCVTSSVQISNIRTINPSGTLGSSVGGVPYPIDSTSCLGYVTSPDNDFGNGPNPNIGGLGDGLLNQEVFKNYFISGDHFLTHPNDSMVDLDGDGIKTDPGWIRLGGSDTGGTGDWSFNYDAINGYDLAQILDVTFGTRIENGNLIGYWTLYVDPSAIPFVTNALGRPTLFDHLAFVLKGPNTNNQGADQFGEWAVYDFNFYELIDAGLEVSLGDQTYAFTGTWDASTVFDGKDLSHLSIWAHDPPISTRVQIPEPTTFMLVAFSLLLIRFRLLNS